MDNKNYTTLSNNVQQIPIKYFEKTVEFPTKKRYERWKTYVSRMFEWDRQRLEYAQKKGMYRPIPHLPVSPLARGLLVTLAWHSYAEGSDYYPVRLSLRQAGALAGDYSKTAGKTARESLDELLEVGAIELLEEPKGSRPGLYRIIAPAVAPPRAQSAPKDTKTPEPAAAPLPIEAKQIKKLTTDVRKRFPDLHPNVLQALIETVGVSVILNQLDWFPYRDNSWARNGEVAAFVSYCKRREPAPPSILRRLRDEQEARDHRLAAERHKQAMTAEREISAKKLASMDSSKLERLKERVRKKLGGLFTGYDSMVFCRALEAEAAK